MYLEIVTPDQKVFEGEISSATFPGSNGTFQVLKNHAPLVSSLVRGRVKYKSNEGDKEVTVTGGIVEVLNNNITLLAEGVAE